MPPGKKDEQEFAQDVGGRNVEVVFQGADGDVAVDLQYNRFSTLLRAGPRGAAMDCMLTFCSTYSCPAMTALLPTWNPICAV